MCRKPFFERVFLIALVLIKHHVYMQCWQWQHCVDKMELVFCRLQAPKQQIDNFLFMHNRDFTDMRASFVDMWTLEIVLLTRMIIRQNYTQLS